MNRYELKDIKQADEFLIRRDSFLVILYADCVPPHLSLSVQGKLFSLDVKGATIGDDIAPTWRLIHQRKIETLFVQLQLPPLIDLSVLREQLAQLTSAYPSVKIGNITCLAPIKDFCSKVYSTEVSDVDFVFDLLPKLEEQGVLADTYHANMDRYLDNDGAFKLRTYSMFDVNHRISVANQMVNH